MVVRVVFSFPFFFSSLYESFDKCFIKKEESPCEDPVFRNKYVLGWSMHYQSVQWAVYNAVRAKSGNRKGELKIFVEQISKAG